MIDAHQHFWKFNPSRDEWMDPQTMGSIRRDFGPADLVPLMSECSIRGTIAVQADQSVEETEYLLSIAEQHAFVMGVVGWTDLRAGSLKRPTWSGHPKLVGFRHVLQSEPTGFMLDPNFISGVQRIGRDGFTYDILVYAHQLPEVVQFVAQCSDQPLILDHLGKPEIRTQKLKEWQVHMSTLSQCPTLYCKLSGMVTEAEWHSWTYETLAPYLDVCLTSFGEDRCVFGYDWPVCTLAASYRQVVEVMIRYLNERGVSTQKVMSDNCLKFYGLAS
ncbi:MAG: amidohydrolase family protein [Saprospiraceae bacterium]|nr:amidohydrolase family protein [Saprospiraceae bacterium]